MNEQYKLERYNEERGAYEYYQERTQQEKQQQKEDYNSIWKRAERVQEEKMHYRKALYAACGNDKTKVSEFLKATR